MYIDQKNFKMTQQNSTEITMIRPDELMAELGIKKSKYYEILKDLGIKASKDSSKKSYLTLEQALDVRTYLLDDIQTSENDDSDNSSIVKADDSNLVASTNNNSAEDIYVKSEEPEANLESNIVREAEELAARGMAMNNLLKIQLASQMSFDDLSPDLQEKVNIAREVANPKWTPAELASKILAQHRSNRRVQS